jgi:hypothetical protein
MYAEMHVGLHVQWLSKLLDLNKNLNATPLLNSMNKLILKSLSAYRQMDGSTR